MGVVLTASLEELLQELAGRKGVPHAVLAVERDGGFRWAGAAGRADPDGTAMQPHTPFFVASIDKLYTAVMVLKLVERGDIALDESFTTYLPEPLWRGLHRRGGVDRTTHVTVRDLLAHTSGLADYLEDAPPGGRCALRRLVEEGDRRLEIEEVARLVREELRPHFPPGERVRYSDTNYRLLLAIVESIAAQPLHVAVADMILRPAHLRQTWVAGQPRPEMPNEAAVWFGDSVPPAAQALESMFSIYATAADLIAFLRWLVNGGAFAHPATMASMQSWRRFRFPTDAAAFRAPGWPVEYGLGIMRFRLPRFLTPLRRMPAVIGHTGSTGSFVFHAPELGLYTAGTVSQGTAGAVPYRLVPKILRLMTR